MTIYTSRRLRDILRAAHIIRAVFFTILYAFLTALNTWQYYAVLPKHALNVTAASLPFNSPETHPALLMNVCLHRPVQQNGKLHQSLPHTSSLGAQPHIYLIPRHNFVLLSLLSLPSTCQGRRLSTRSGYISISFVVYPALFFQQRGNGGWLSGTCISLAVLIVLILPSPQQIFLTSLPAVQLQIRFRIFISAACTTYRGQEHKIIW